MLNQAEFSFALRQPDAPPPPGLRGPDGPSLRRFAVYRNNVAASLRSALAANFPALVRLLGADYFRALAAEFIAAHPPRCPILHEYGADLADFIEAFPPLAEYPYLADVARLERAWLDAYHSADAEPIDPRELQQVPHEKLAGCRFAVHPATRVLCSNHPALSLFLANRREVAPGLESDRPTPSPAGAEDVLVTRPGLAVETRRLAPGVAAFLQTLVDGRTLADALGAGQRAASTFDLAAGLRELLAAGAFVGLRQDCPSDEKIAGSGGFRRVLDEEEISA